MFRVSFVINISVFKTLFEAAYLALQVGRCSARSLFGEYQTQLYSVVKHVFV
ncbi:hypothetical protein JCM18905_4594 [Vibrio sp. JCM 18905]|nr:hypothetical protein JCM18905_4594 [Vibrio sp. JCM 18905]